MIIDYNNIGQLQQACIYLVYNQPSCVFHGVSEELRRQYTKHGFVVEKHFLDHGFVSHHLLQSMDSLSMFSQRRYLELHTFADKLQPEVIELLAACQTKHGPDICITLLASGVSKLPKATGKAAILSQIKQIPIREIPPWQMERWIMRQGKQMGLELSEITCLKIAKKAANSSEMAQQLLLRMQLQGSYSEEIINDYELSGENANVQALIDNMLLDDLTACIANCAALRRHNTELVILLWHLEYTITSLLQMNKQSPTSWIPASKQKLYKHKLSQPNCIQLLLNAMARLNTLDEAIKGVLPFDPWIELEQIIAILCGHKVMPAYIQLKKA